MNNERIIADYLKDNFSMGQLKYKMYFSDDRYYKSENDKTGNLFYNKETHEFISTPCYRKISFH